MQGKDNGAGAVTLVDYEAAKVKRAVERGRRRMLNPLVRISLDKPSSKSPSSIRWVTSAEPGELGFAVLQCSSKSYIPTIKIIYL